MYELAITKYLEHHCIMQHLETPLTTSRLINQFSQLTLLKYVGLLRQIALQYVLRQAMLLHTMNTNDQSKHVLLAVLNAPTSTTLINLCIYMVMPL